MNYVLFSLDCIPRRCIARAVAQTLGQLNPNCASRNAGAARRVQRPEGAAPGEETHKLA